MSTDASNRGKRRPLLARGELLTTKAERGGGGGDKFHPLSIDESHALLAPQAERLAAELASMPAALRGRHVVVEATLHPNYLASSYMPDAVLRNNDLYLVGTRLSQGVLKTPKKELHDQPTKTLLLAGELRSVAAFAKSVGAPPWTRVDDWDELREFSELSLPQAHRVIVRRPRLDGSTIITWESVLSQIGRTDSEIRSWNEEAEEKWVALVVALGGEVALDYGRRVGKLNFLPISLPVDALDRAAEFNLLRALRPMPKVRTFPEPVVRGASTKVLAPPLATKPVSDDPPIAIFDGGVKTTSHYFGPFVTSHVATGSGIERAMRCEAASVLPRVWTESSIYAQRGTAIHAHLERLAHGTSVAESLLLVDEEHRDAAATVDVASLADDLTLSPEVALAYRPADDTARLIGQGLARDYSTVGLDEIPLTIDLAGRRQDHGVVRDYKTGHRNVTRAGTNWQMIGASLAVSRAFDLDEIEATVIYVRPGRDVYRDTARLTGLELAGYAAELRALMPRVAANRARIANGEHVEPTEGDWCQYCPSRFACPAKVGTLRLALELASGARIIPAGDLVRSRELVREARRELARLEKQLDSTLAAPVRLAIDDDGTEHWYGAHREPGPDVIDGKVAVAAVAAHLKLPEDRVRNELLGERVTKERIKKLAAKVAPSGAIAATERALLAAIAAAGGITQPDVERVGHFTQRTATTEAT